MFPEIWKTNNSSLGWTEVYFSTCKLAGQTYQIKANSDIWDNWETAVIIFKIEVAFSGDTKIQLSFGVNLTFMENRT